MQSVKISIVALFFLANASFASANVWYDRLPKSGELTPKESGSVAVPQDFLENTGQNLEQNLSPQPEYGTSEKMEASFDTDAVAGQISSEIAADEESSYGNLVAFIVAAIIIIFVFIYIKRRKNLTNSE